MTPVQRNTKPLVTRRSAAAPICGACGKGVFRPTDVRGRTFAFRDEHALALTESLVLPVCTVCGEIREGRSDTRTLDALLEKTYSTRRAAMTADLVQRLLDMGWRQIEIEQTMGLSTGYLSKVLRGEKALGVSTFRQLMLLAMRPRQTLRDLAKLFPQMRALEKSLESRGALVAA